ncbi:hypothetical protein [Halococcoides cellulosivorans]|uniref:Uncharacterized protein n=1 Tax=Halococcoides cellulosivorans TaxID=1679096 RepID=A0A2R4X3R3_9EURY|nr:hypothetical protein [Halococcoides cellulosivorans]AWB28436.1 hypothetical protein HARCEL1_12365 [Halococcoides cellulosivorans]
MSQDQSSPKTTRSTDIEAQLTRKIPRQVALIVVFLTLFAAQPVAAAEESAVCSADKLPSMIEGFFQITTALGIMGLVIVWQADSLMEMFTFNPEQKKGLKRHKRSAMKSAVILLVLGPLYSVAGEIMGLPLAECIDLVPW